MFDKIIDVLLQCFDFLIPFTVMDQFERGVILRFGKLHREIGPGFHWHWPLAIERCLFDNVVDRTVNLGSQSLTTRDGRNVTVSGVITARIRDIKKALLEVEGFDDALKDSCYGAIAVAVSSHTWEEIQQETFSDALTKACRDQANEYGIKIKRVQLTDKTIAKPIRLYMN